MLTRPISKYPIMASIIIPESNRLEAAIWNISTKVIMVNTIAEKPKLIALKI